MLKIEIFQDDVKINTRISPGKEGKPPRTIREQDAYAHISGRFPTLMKLQVEEGQPPYEAGVYTVHSSSFVVNNFGALELKRFGQMIEPLELEL
ncbi:single-stranded DNA-binding protein [Thaumasiovibrio subtropicus]|uniref:single-stranded DNA-binding protein n=1 Tax=Thaumasiovibrio subtropicus TaxID=1891207 RepID=UPI000B363C0F|nr:single-stranded DNA-binding protein [Thaumasiovibrio subtropicus]